MKFKGKDKLSRNYNDKSYTSKKSETIKDNTNLSTSNI